MSGDSYREVTSQSWFSRLGGSFRGILAGIVIFILAFPLLYWNEGRAVKTHRTLEEGGGSVVTVAPGHVDAANEGRLVHVTGIADTGTTLTDAVFGLTAVALQLERTVEMYQWDETLQTTTEKKLGGATETTSTYTYSRRWADRPIDSARFRKPDGHRNPGGMPFQSGRQVAADARLGAYTLAPSLVERINTFEPLPVTAENAPPGNLGDRLTIHDGGYHTGSDPLSPEIGDTRIRFRVVRPAQVSIIAAQRGERLEPYHASSGGTIELLQPGTRSAESMIESAQQANSWLTWILRLAGLFVMQAGLGLVLRPLSVIADVVPLVGNLVAGGTGLVSLLLAAIFSLLTIAIAWLAYRPVLAVVLMVAAAGVAVAIWRLRKPRRTAAAPVSAG